MPFIAISVSATPIPRMVVRKRSAFFSLVGIITIANGFSLMIVPSASMLFSIQIHVIPRIWFSKFIQMISLDSYDYIRSAACCSSASHKISFFF